MCSRKRPHPLPSMRPPPHLQNIASHHRATRRGWNHKSKARGSFLFVKAHPIQQPSSVRSFRHRHGKTNQINIRTNFFQERLGCLLQCDRESCGGDQSKPYGLTVLVRQSRLAFDGVREGMAQIQDGPHAVFFSIFGHHRCFDLAGPQRKRVTRFNLCRKQCIPVITNKSQEVRDLGVARASGPPPSRTVARDRGVKRGSPRRPTHRRVAKHTKKIFSQTAVRQRTVCSGLPPEGSIHHGQQRGRHVHDLNSASATRPHPTRSPVIPPPTETSTPPAIHSMGEGRIKNATNGFQRLRRLGGLNSEWSRQPPPALADFRQHLSRRSRPPIDRQPRACHGPVQSELPAESPAVPSPGLIFFRIKCEFTFKIRSPLGQLGSPLGHAMPPKLSRGRGEDQNANVSHVGVFPWPLYRRPVGSSTSRTQCSTNKMRAEPATGTPQAGKPGGTVCQSKANMAKNDERPPPRLSTATEGQRQPLSFTLAPTGGRSEGVFMYTATVPCSVDTNHSSRSRQG